MALPASSNAIFSMTKTKEESFTSDVSQIQPSDFVENIEVPPFSTLNADVIPTADFLQGVEHHQAKIEPDLIKRVWQQAGLQTQDERVYKVASAMCEMQMLKIIAELKLVGNTQKKSSHKTHLTFEDLRLSMDEFGVALRRPPFLVEKSKPAQRRSRSKAE